MQAGIFMVENIRMHEGHLIRSCVSTFVSHLTDLSEDFSRTNTQNEYQNYMGEARAVFRGGGGGW